MLRIFIQGQANPIFKDWIFNRRNINKIAYNYDAKVEKFDIKIKFATLKLHVGGLVMVDTVSKRFYAKNYTKTFTK